jgi:hypothetical protein
MGYGPTPIRHLRDASCVEGGRRAIVLKVAAVRGVRQSAGMIRVLLAISSLILLAGGTIHAAAFRRFDAAVAATSLSPFYGNASRALWLIDSATQFIVAAAFAFIAIRPASASAPVIALIGLVPAATAVLIYVFVGNFAAGHLLTAAAMPALIAAALSALR